MNAILGIKKGMTQVFDEKGLPRPVTLVLAGPCEVTFIKTQEKDGYNAVQIGFGQEKKIKKPLAGHLKGKRFKYLKEVKAKEGEEVTIGKQVTVEIFAKDDKVKVTGISKGRGFAGTIKRHHFSRGPVSHGHPFSRKPGSIGSMFPERVLKGLRMAGRMGGKQVSVKNLRVFAVDAQKNLLMLLGAVPGAINSLLLIEKTTRKPAN
jgi:large subunit ribosomal protein L3